MSAEQIEEKNNGIIEVHSVPPSKAKLWIPKAFQLYKKWPFGWTALTFIIFFTPTLLGKIFLIPGIIIGDFLQLILGIGFYRFTQKAMISDTENNFPENLPHLKLLIKDLKNSDTCMQLIWLKLLTYFSILAGIALLVLINFSFGLTLKDYMSILQLISSKMFYLIPESFFKILFIDMSLILIFSMFIGAGLFFAPLLIANYQINIFHAFKLSFKANFKNVAAFLHLFIVGIPLLLGVIITLGLGAFVVAPLFNLAFVFAYDDIFNPETPK